MTTIKMLGSLGLLVGLALVLTTDAPGNGYEPPRYGTMSVFDGKDYFGNVIHDGDRFVVIRFRQGDGIQRPRNHKSTFPDTLEVDDKYLGYDLRGKNKNVLVRERSGDDTRWKFVSSEAERPYFGYFRVKNGDLKGWWIGLGPIEQQKKGEGPAFDRLPRAPLILVKDKKDAAGFRWTQPEKDDGR